MLIIIRQISLHFLQNRTMPLQFFAGEGKGEKENAYHIRWLFSGVVHFTDGLSFSIQ